MPGNVGSGGKNDRETGWQELLNRASIRSNLNEKRFELFLINAHFKKKSFYSAYTHFPDTDYKAYYWSRTPETRDAAKNMMSETTVQPEDLAINNANENAFFQSFMLPRRPP